MTGAAHISITAIIFQRPTTVRRPSAPSSAWLGDGIECTVRPSGSSEAAFIACAAPRAAVGGNDLEPDIEDDHEGGKPEPLECIAVVLLQTQSGGRPVALQPLGSGADLLQRHIGSQRQLGFGAERFQVEILP